MSEERKINCPIWQKHPQTRNYGLINVLGLFTFYIREIRRSFKIWGITLVAPAIRALLFVTVFSLIIEDSAKLVLGLPFLNFLIPGLIAVAILERAFESAAFSMVYDKSEGIFDDLAIVPLSPFELVVAYAGSSITAGISVGAVVWLVLLPFGGQIPVLPFILAYFVISGSLILGLFSQIVGLFAPKWDYLISIQVFVFLPFVFFSGVFFTIDQLPQVIQYFTWANPIFYIVDGVRYGITGVTDGEPLIGVFVTLICIFVLSAICHRLFRIGYRYRF